jgi:undecaprenyl-diphosphatase
MPLPHIVFLSIVQGITEFLPISSSGHLILVPKLFGWKDQGLVMDVAVHLGTLGAVLIYFWRDVLRLFLGFIGLLRGRITQDTYLFFALCLGTIPAVIFGLTLTYIGTDHLRSFAVIGWTSIVFGCALYGIDRFSESTLNLNALTLKKAWWIGMAQAIALIPGTSRSGITITMGRALGFSRVEAARFAFLLCIPSIIAAATLTSYQALKSGEALMIQELSVAILVSFCSGLAAIAFLLRWLKHSNFTVFIAYRLALGSFLLYLAYFTGY